MIVQFAFPVHALQRHDVSAVVSGHPLHFLSLAVFHNHFFFFLCGKAGSRTPWQNFGKRTAISQYYKPPLRFGIAACRGLSSISIDGLPSQGGRCPTHRPGSLPPVSGLCIYLWILPEDLRHSCLQPQKQQVILSIKFVFAEGLTVFLPPAIENQYNQ